MDVFGSLSCKKGSIKKTVQGSMFYRSRIIKQSRAGNVIKEWCNTAEVRES